MLTNNERFQVALEGLEQIDDMVRNFHTVLSSEAEKANLIERLKTRSIATLKRLERLPTRTPTNPSTYDSLGENND